MPTKFYSRLKTPKNLLSRAMNYSYKAGRLASRQRLSTMTASTILLPLIMLSTLSGCGDDISRYKKIIEDEAAARNGIDNTTIDNVNEDDANTVKNPHQFHLRIGTDMNVNALTQVGNVYSEQTGVQVTWVPLYRAFVKEPAQFKMVYGSATTDSVNQDSQHSINTSTSRANIFESPRANHTATAQKLPADTNIVEVAPIDDAAKTSATEDVLPTLDVFLMHSAYSLHAAEQRNLLQPVGSDWLITRIPANYQNPKGTWYGLTYYGRTIIYNKNKVNVTQLDSYAELANNDFYGRFCITGLRRPENQAIIKAMLPYHGTINTPKLMAGWIRNRPVISATDTEVLKNIEQGTCDVGLVDSDMFWQYIKMHPQSPVRLTWVNKDSRGTLTNAISAGVARQSQQPDQALLFMEWLASEGGQALLAFNTSTFPLATITNKNINQQALRPAWTQFNPNKTPLVERALDEEVVLPMGFDSP